MLHPDLLAERGLLAEQLVDDRLAEDADLGRRCVLFSAEHLSRGERPGTNVEVRGGGADDLGEPVRVAVDDLCAGAAHRCDCADGRGQLLLDRLGIVAREVLRRARARRRTALHHRAGLDHQHVRAQRGHLGRHFRLRALADGDGGDHRRHRDDDAERGEE